MFKFNGEQKVGLILKHGRAKAERVTFCTGNATYMQKQCHRGMCLVKIFKQAKLK